MMGFVLSVWLVLFVLALVLAVYGNKLTKETRVLFAQYLGTLAVLALLAAVAPLLLLATITAASCMYFSEKALSPSRGTLEFLWKGVGSFIIAAGFVNLVALMTATVTVQGVERNGRIVYDLTPHFLNGLESMFWLLIVFVVGAVSLYRGFEYQQAPADAAAPTGS